jgi:hypothetical protein
VRYDVYLPSAPSLDSTKLGLMRLGVADISPMRSNGCPDASVARKVTTGACPSATVTDWTW